MLFFAQGNYFFKEIEQLDSAFCQQVLLKINIFLLIFYYINLPMQKFH